MNNVLETGRLTRSFTQGGETIHVLRGVDLTVAPGEIVALVEAHRAAAATDELVALGNRAVGFLADRIPGYIGP